MIFFHITGGSTSLHVSTIAEAKIIARHLAQDTGHDIEVTEVDIPTTRNNILRLLNNSGGTHHTVAVRFTATPKPTPITEEHDRRNADRIDGMDRDDLGESPDY